MNDIVYPAIFEFDDEGYDVSFSDLDGCYTCADTFTEGLAIAKEVLSLYIIVSIKHNDIMPKPLQFKPNMVAIAPEPTEAQALQS